MLTSAAPAKIAVVGYGPAGMSAAALLGQLGHEVVVIERWPKLYGLPRLTHIDDETARILQGICDIDKALADSTPIRYEWFNGKNELLLEVPTITRDQGYPARNSIHQPDIEDAIDERLRSLPNVEIRQGWALIDYSQDEAGVHLRIAPWEGKAANEEAAVSLDVDYLIGADGNRSVVREVMGTGRKDFDFHEQWINIDTEWLRPHDGSFTSAKQFCDPARGHMFMGIGLHRQRFEFAVLPGEDAAQFEKTEAAWEWLERTHGLGPKDLKIIRHLSYTFVGRTADEWRQGRVFLAGDAAHVTPPYLGQGACSGIRDAANLAWKLDLVATGRAPQALLDTYQEERMPHATAVIEMSIALGKIANTTDREAAAARDAAFMSGMTPPPLTLPRIEGSLLPSASQDSPTGQMSPQGVLARDGQAQRGDDVLGAGFRLLALPGALDQLGDPERAILSTLKTQVHVLDVDVEDVDSTYVDYLKAHAAQALVIRPDHLVHATATAEELPAVIADLGQRLDLTVQGEPRAFSQHA
ncbi:bifunctional 3-(3-hydroxy-phenyl)propionate/3-hydroxycinnamic acid hydroxylase [Paeniglutamicibacter sp. MACA_103]|uniref:bifunctional 3-(3-hydroxy-phenyl)propionate/3-hydroxycinnamic acid hydroxylase n=1 Tax=Paeniglutamicibacter sp. MACA_103 TaxID=3377337 RepID=UPI0038933A25